MSGGRKQYLWDALQAVRRLRQPPLTKPLVKAQQHFLAGAWTGGVSDDFAVDIAWRLDDLDQAYDQAEQLLGDAWLREPDD